jgi:hypothetical protein
MVERGGFVEVSPENSSLFKSKKKHQSKTKTDVKL